MDSTSLLRKWLHRIALGLPPLAFVPVPLIGVQCGPCHPTVHSSAFVIESLPATRYELRLCEPIGTDRLRCLYQPHGSVDGMDVHRMVSCAEVCGAEMPCSTADGASIDCGGNATMPPQIEGSGEAFRVRRADGRYEFVNEAGVVLTLVDESGLARRLAQLAEESELPNGRCAADGDLALQCSYLDTSNCVGGRRPSGSMAHASRSTGRDHLREQAVLEAASVPAFAMLARELELHGAPVVLPRAARRSMHDEVRHASIMSSLAGAEIAVTVAIGEPRSLEAMAFDNAREGCVREAFGAIEAAWQSTQAHDPAVRAANALIARDEARHALLSLAIEEWSAPRVGRAPLRAAREEAAHRLDRELRTRTLIDGAGMMPAEPALALLDVLA